MRWERLFAELEARFDALEDADAAAERADRERVAVGAVSTNQRLRGTVDRMVRVRVAGGGVVGGVLKSVGPDWLLVSEGQGRDCIVALGAITMVEGLSTSTGPELAGLDLKLDLRRALRGVARDRSPVAVGVTGWSGGAAGLGSASGYGSDSGEVTGTIDRVGADFIEVAMHAAWEPRRANTVRSVALVPLAAVVVVRALPLG